MPALYRHGHTLMTDYTPTSAVVAGDVIVLDEEVRIAHSDIEADQLGALAVPSGSAVYLVDKETGEGAGFADGQKAFWDAGAAVVTNDDDGGGNKPFGFAVAAAADAAATAMVRHDVVAVTPAGPTTTEEPTTTAG